MDKPVARLLVSDTHVHIRWMQYSRALNFQALRSTATALDEVPLCLLFHQHLDSCDAVMLILLHGGRNR